MMCFWHMVMRTQSTKGIEWVKHLSAIENIGRKRHHNSVFNSKLKNFR